MRYRFLAIPVVLLLSVPAFSEDTGGKTAPFLEAVVMEVIDGETLVPDQAVDHATRVKLVGIQSPKPSIGRPEIKAWPLADEARDTLSALTLNQRVILKFTGPRTDRHSRALAHVYRDDGLWIQGEMLKQGMARVLTYEDNRALATEMLALEESARKQGLGIWSHPFYAVRAPEDAERDIGSFQVVQGRVLKATHVKGRIYLNFGADWRTDFTVSVSTKVLRDFERAGLDLLSLTGRDIRVRGWLKDFNGPMIDVSHPEQIEVLSE